MDTLKMRYHLIALRRQLSSSVKKTSLFNRLWLWSAYHHSAYLSRKYQHPLCNIRTFCLFVGFARSGHSIVGFLLDAHPKIMMADELDPLRYALAGFSKGQICALIVAKSKWQQTRKPPKIGRKGIMFSYDVPGQWRGRFDTLGVIGSTAGSRSRDNLANHPGLLQDFQKTMSGIELKIVLVTRNPFDIISTMSVRSNRHVDLLIEKYFAHCEKINRIRDMYPDNFFILPQEELLAEPHTTLRKLCNFLNLEASPDYLDDCASILFTSPAKSRQQITWDAAQINAVQNKINDFDFLKGYTHND